MKKNIALVVVSVLIVFALTLLADRILGMAVSGGAPTGSIELIFPPGSEKAFSSIEFTYHVHVNALGLRDREFAPQRSKTFRIAAIGDSFTYGWGVEVEQSWPKVLEQNLRQKGADVEIINMGKPGAGPPFYAELAERAIPLLRPDLIVVGVLQDDVGESMPDGVAPAAGPQRGLIFQIVRRAYPNAVRLAREMKERNAARSAPVGSPEKSSIEDNRRSNADAAQRLIQGMTPEQRARFERLEESVRQAFESGNINPYMFDLSVIKNPDYYQFLMKIDDPYIKKCVESMGTQLKRIVDIAGEFGAKVLVAPVPLGPYVNLAGNASIRRVGFASDASMLDSDSPDREIKDAAEQAGAPFISVTSTFKEHKNDTGLYYPLDGHFTPAGHKLFADLLTPLIAERIH